MSERDAYIEKMKAQLDAWNAKIAEFEAQAKKTEAETQLHFEKQLEEIREKRDDASRYLKEMQNAGNDALEALQHGADNAWDEMTRAFKNAADRFK
jgi:predicted  nucleic acid-binding Zn-ribbon protein